MITIALDLYLQTERHPRAARPALFYRIATGVKSAVG